MISVKEKFPSFIVAPSKKFIPCKSRKTLLNDPVWHEPDKTYTYLFGFWSRFWKASVVMVARIDFFVYKRLLVHLDWYKQIQWLMEKPWQSTINFNWTSNWMNRDEFSFTRNQNHEESLRKTVKNHAYAYRKEDYRNQREYFCLSFCLAVFDC